MIRNLFGTFVQNGLATVVFAGLVTASAFADNVVHPGTPTLDRPTLTALGLQLPITGDDNFNAQVSVQYRVTGTSKWFNALPLFRVHPETVQNYTVAPQFAGSIFDLRPATSYDIQLHVTDPDGPVDQTFTLSARTRPVPGDPATPRVVNVMDSNSLAAALSSAQPGDVITLANGNYSGSFSLLASGTAANPIVVRGQSEDGVVLDAGNCSSCNGFEIYGSWVHLERLTLQNAFQGLKFQTAGSQGNVVRRVHIKNTVLGMGMQVNQLDYYMADNILEGRLQWPLTVPDDNFASTNDDGIVIQGFGIVVSHNRISGYSTAVNNYQTGARAFDIVGNDVLWTYNCATKQSLSEGNSRVWRNRFTNMYMAMSVQPIYGGPTYFMRNVAVNISNEQMKFHAFGSPYTEPSGILVYHNTFVSPYESLTVQTNTQSHYFSIENNLFIGPASPQKGVPVDWESPIDNGMFDYNGYYPDGTFVYVYPSWRDVVPSFAALAATGVEQHGVGVTPQTLASGLTGPVSHVALVQPQDAALASNSPAIDRGLVLPNINDNYTGAAPDLGALELGCPEPTYGPRAEGVDESNEVWGCSSAVVTPPAQQVPASIVAFSGTAQSTAVNTAFATGVSAKVLDGSGNPIQGVTVIFVAPSSGASASFGGGVITTANTDATGVATSPVPVANGTVGTYTVTASIPVIPAASFTLTNTSSVQPQVPHSIAAMGGTPQSATVNTAFASALSAQVLDSSSKPVAGVTVTFTAPASGAGATFNGSATATAVTNASGIATSPVPSANGTAGSYTVAASAAGLAAASFALTNNPTPPQQTQTPARIVASGGTGQSAVVNTAFGAGLSAQVLDASSKPIAGVLVIFVAPSSGASASFSGSVVTTATTNASGIATTSIPVANGTTGTYTITASVPVIPAARFTLTNTSAAPPPAVNQTPAAIVPASGTPQSTHVNTAFPSGVSAQVLDSSSK